MPVGIKGVAGRAINRCMFETAGEDGRIVLEHGTDKVALVAGANKGTGREIARQL